jgi:hypothetical protein
MKTTVVECQHAVDNQHPDTKISSGVGSTNLLRLEMKVWTRIANFIPFPRKSLTATAPGLHRSR